MKRIYFVPGYAVDSLGNITEDSLRKYAEISYQKSIHNTQLNIVINEYKPLTRTFSIHFYEIDSTSSYAYPNLIGIYYVDQKVIDMTQSRPRDFHSVEVIYDKKKNKKIFKRIR